MGLTGGNAPEALIDLAAAVTEKRRVTQHFRAPVAVQRGTDD